MRNRLSIRKDRWERIRQLTKQEWIMRHLYVLIGLGLMLALASPTFGVDEIQEIFGTTPPGRDGVEGLRRVPVASAHASSTFAPGTPSSGLNRRWTCSSMMPCGDASSVPSRHDNSPLGSYPWPNASIHRGSRSTHAVPRSHSRRELSIPSDHTSQQLGSSKRRSETRNEQEHPKRRSRLDSQRLKNQL